MVLSIGQAARILGVAVSTLRRWEQENRFLPAFRTIGGHRRYQFEVLQKQIEGQQHTPIEKKTVAYARVSSHDQKEDLGRQVERLRLHCSEQHYNFDIISDLGSGLNYNKKGLNRLLGLLCRGEVQRLVLTHRDRLLRFGSPLLFKICAFYGTEVIVLDDGKQKTFEEELVKDVLELMTVFTAKVHGKRSHSQKKALIKSKQAA